MWGRVLAIFGGTIIFVFAVAIKGIDAIGPNLLADTCFADVFEASFVFDFPVE